MCCPRVHQYMSRQTILQCDIIRYPDKNWRQPILESFISFFNFSDRQIVHELTIVIHPDRSIVRGNNGKMAYLINIICINISVVAVYLCNSVQTWTCCISALLHVVYYFCACARFLLAYLYVVINCTFLWSCKKV